MISHYYKAYGIILFNIAYIYQLVENYFKAQQLNVKALEISYQLGDERRVLEASNNLGICLAHLKKEPQAYQYFLISLGLSEKLGNQSEKQQILENVSKLKDKVDQTLVRDCETNSRKWLQPSEAQLIC